MEDVDNNDKIAVENDSKSSSKIIKSGGSIIVITDAADVEVWAKERTTNVENALIHTKYWIALGKIHA